MCIYIHWSEIKCKLLTLNPPSTWVPFVLPGWLWPLRALLHGTSGGVCDVIGRSFGCCGCVVRRPWIRIVFRRIPWMLSWIAIWGIWRPGQQPWTVCLLGPIHGRLWCMRCSGTFLLWPALTFFLPLWFVLYWLLCVSRLDSLAFGPRRRFGRPCH